MNQQAVAIIVAGALIAVIAGTNHWALFHRWTSNVITCGGVSDLGEMPCPIRP